ncbi:MAG: hypothetical protein RLZZ584_3567, partial [Pseudomonadota bacterium]
VTPLLTGPARCLRPVHDSAANLAEVLRIRTAVPARERPVLAELDRRRPGVVRRVVAPVPALAFPAR